MMSSLANKTCDSQIHVTFELMKYKESRYQNNFRIPHFWILFILSFILFMAEGCKSALSTQCFNQNQYPITMRSDNSNWYVIFSSLDVQQDYTNNLVVCGRIGRNQDTWKNPAVGFMNNIVGETRLKWFWEYTFVNSQQGIWMSYISCRNIRVSTSHTILAAFQNYDSRYFFVSLNYTDGSVIKALFLGDMPTYDRYQSVEISDTTGEMFIIIDQAGIGSEWHTQIVKFSKNLEQLIWVKEIGQTGTRYIFLASILLQQNTSDLWAAGVDYILNERWNLALAKFDSKTSALTGYSFHGWRVYDSWNLNIPQLIALDFEQKYLFGCITNAIFRPNSEMSYFVYSLESGEVTDYYKLSGQVSENFICAGLGTAKEGFQILFQSKDPVNSPQYIYTVKYNSPPPFAQFGQPSITFNIKALRGSTPYSIYFTQFKQRKTQSNSLLKFFYSGVYTDSLTGQQQGYISYLGGDEYTCEDLLLTVNAPNNGQSFSLLNTTLGGISALDVPIISSQIIPYYIWFGLEPINYKLQQYYPFSSACSVQGQLVIHKIQSNLLNLTVPYTCEIGETSTSNCLIEIAQYQISTCTDSYTMNFQIVDVNQNNFVITSFQEIGLSPYRIYLSKQVLSYLSPFQDYTIKIIASFDVDSYQYVINDQVEFKIQKKIIIDREVLLPYLSFNDQRYYIGDQSIYIFQNVPANFWSQGTLVYIKDTQFNFSSAYNIHENFLKFNEETLVSIISSNDSSLAGNQVQIKVFATFTLIVGGEEQQVTVALKFKVTLISQKLKNQAPQFDQELKDQATMCTFLLKYQLPSVKDKEFDAHQITLHNKESPQFPKFTELQDDLMIFNPGESDFGNFEIEILLSQKNNLLLYNLYSFKLTVIPLNQTLMEMFELRRQISQAQEDLKAKVFKISNTGLMTIQFEKSMFIFSNITESLNLSLSIYLIQGSKSYEVKYKIIDYYSSNLKIQLEFGDLLNTISQLDIDSVQVVFSKEDIYVDSSVRQKIRKGYKISKSIQSQITEDEWNAQNAVVQVVKATIITLFGISSTLNIILSQSLASIWGMIEGFQLITHLPMISINLPANTLCFFSLLNDIANLNLVDTDDFTNSIFDLDQFEFKPFNAHFEFMNYGSTDLIQNLGLMFYALLINALLTCFGLALQLFNLTQKSGFASKLYGVLIFNQILRFLAEAQLELTICSLINLSDMRFEATGNVMSSLISLITLAINISLPLLAVQSIRHKRYLNDIKGLAFKKKSFHEESNQYDKLLMSKQLERLKLFYENLNLEGSSIFVYSFTYWIRKSIYSLLMIAFPYNPQICLLLHIQCGQVVLMMIHHFKPYENKNLTQLIIFNEHVFIITCYSFIPFLNFVETSNDLRTEMGYIPIGLILMYLLFNTAIILWDLGTTLMLKLSVQILRHYKQRTKKEQTELEISKEDFHESLEDYLQAKNQKESNQSEITITQSLVQNIDFCLPQNAQDQLSSRVEKKIKTQRRKRRQPSQPQKEFDFTFKMAHNHESNTKMPSFRSRAISGNDTQIMFDQTVDDYYLQMKHLQKRSKIKKVDSGQSLISNQNKFESNEVPFEKSEYQDQSFCYDFDDYTELDL